MEATWDNTATTYGVWTQTIVLAVAALNDAFDTLVVKGITSNTRGTVFMSIRHMLITVHQLDSTEYTWDTPSPTDPETNLSAADITRLDTLEANVTNDELKMYTFSPIHISELDNAVLQSIASHILDPIGRAEYVAKFARSGRAALRHNAANRRTTNDSVSTAIGLKFDHIVARGLGDWTTSSFIAVTTALTHLNNSNSATEAKSDSMMGLIFTNLVGEHSDAVKGLLKTELMLNKHKLTAECVARGTTPTAAALLEMTKSTCKDAIEELTIESFITRDRHARANQAIERTERPERARPDPIKNTRTAAPSKNKAGKPIGGPEWTEAKGWCYTCGGPHWNATCTATPQQRADWKSLLDSGAKSKGDKANLARDHLDQLTEMISGEGGEFTLAFDDDEAEAAEFFAGSSKGYSVRARSPLPVATQQPSPRLFGKAYSSDITGDGPPDMVASEFELVDEEAEKRKNDIIAEVEIGVASGNVPNMMTLVEVDETTVGKASTVAEAELDVGDTLSPDPARDFNFEAARTNLTARANEARTNFTIPSGEWTSDLYRAVNAPEPPRSVRSVRLYVFVCNQRPGVYYGTFDRPDNLHLLTNGITGFQGPHQLCVKTLTKALDQCSDRNLPLVFHGPRLDAFGVTAQAVANAGLMISPEMAPAFEKAGVQVRVATEADMTRRDASPRGPQRGGQLDDLVPVPTLAELHVSFGLSDTSTLANLLVNLYSLSLQEGGIHPPPNIGTKPTAKFVDVDKRAFSNGGKGFIDKVAVYIRANVASGPYGATRVEKPIKAGSEDIQYYAIASREHLQRLFSTLRVANQRRAEDEWYSDDALIYKMAELFLPAFDVAARSALTPRYNYDDGGRLVATATESSTGRTTFTSKSFLVPQKLSDERIIKLYQDKLAWDYNHRSSTDFVLESPYSRSEAVLALESPYSRSDGKAQKSGHGSCSTSHLDNEFEPGTRDFLTRLVANVMSCVPWARAHLAATSCVPRQAEGVGGPLEQGDIRKPLEGRNPRHHDVPPRNILASATIDLKSAYLQGNLEPGEAVYCSMPPERDTPEMPEATRAAAPSVMSAVLSCPVHESARSAVPRAYSSRAPRNAARASRTPAPTLQSIMRTLPRLYARNRRLFGATAFTCVDSACNRSSHMHIEHFINFRHKASGIDGAVAGSSAAVIGIGDLVLYMLDVNGTLRKFIIPDVRCVPDFNDSLMSYSQLRASGATINLDRFSDGGLIHLDDADGNAATVPIFAREGMYEMDYTHSPDPSTGPARPPSLLTDSGRAYAVHKAAKTTSHLRAMPADDAATALHWRLLIAPKRISSLSDIVADMPINAVQGTAAPTSFWAEANATKLPHAGKRYRPSHAGRLVHADLAGPFLASRNGGHKYLLVCVDDHSRFKGSYPLTAKSGALAATRRYVRELRAHLNIGRAEPVRLQPVIHSDGGGEFVSNEFSEFIDRAGSVRSLAPREVHDLNGVAERAVRSIMELVRAALAASCLEKDFWVEAACHATTILNVTTGPPDSNKTSHEIVFGEKPKILRILPFGCRAFALRTEYDIMISGGKRVIPFKSQVGINLGLSSDYIDSYDIWIPERSKVITTSDVWFDESLMPLRQPGDQRVGAVVPTPAPPPPTRIDDNGPTTDEPTKSPYEAILNDDVCLAKQSRKVLILFSGDKKRPDGLAAHLVLKGFEAVLIDSAPDKGGGPWDDILNDDTYDSLLLRIKQGEFYCIFAAPPCSTFSVARCFDAPNTKDGGPMPVRDRQHLDGIPGLTARRQSEVKKANNIVNRTVALLLAGYRVGTEFVLENPADHGDPERHWLFLSEQHAPVWLLQSVVSLEKITDAKKATFPMCSFNAPYKKDTTLMFSTGLSAMLSALEDLRCTHKSHAKLAGGPKTDSRGWASEDTAAYPPDFSAFTATALHRSSIVRPDSALSETLAKPTNSSIAPNHETVKAPQEDAIEKKLKSVRMNLAIDGNFGQAPEPAVSKTTLSILKKAADRGLIHPAAAATPAGRTRPPIPPSLTPANLTGGDSSPASMASAEARSPPQAARNLRPDGDSHRTRAAIAEGRALDQSFNKAYSTREPDLEFGWKDKNEAARILLSRGHNADTVHSAASKAEQIFLTRGHASGSRGHRRSRAYAAKDLTSPLNRKQAMASDPVGWKGAEKKELGKHADNESYHVIDRSEMPKGRRTVKLVWVYKVKRDGSLKARLCVQGCSQMPGVDYDQTHCATMRPESLRILAALSARFRLRMRRYDFASAYLQGNLEPGEVVYCSMPPGYDEIGADGLSRICVVTKPIYGMAQAGRRWQRDLFAWLISEGFSQLHSDPCVFQKSVTNAEGHVDRLVIGVYVDDLCVAYSGDPDDSSTLYAEFVRNLSARWEVEDEGEITDLLAVQFDFADGKVKLHQSDYIRRLVDEHGSGAKRPSAQGLKTPSDSGSNGLAQQVADAMTESSTAARPDAALVTKYQSLVGALLYCSTRTRPDIAYAVGMLSRCMSRATTGLYECALRVLFYLERTIDLGLTFDGNPAELFGMSDSNWETNRSTTGFCFLLAGACISWASLRQVSVALSSCEAEIMAASEAGKEGKFLRNFLIELGVSSGEPIDLYVDNQAARDLAYNPEHHKRTKHIDRRARAGGGPNPPRAVRRYGREPRRLLHQIAQPCSVHRHSEPHHERARV